MLTRACFEHPLEGDVFTERGSWRKQAGKKSSVLGTPSWRRQEGSWACREVFLGCR